jgi:dihydroflavonol-4-reductase
MKTLIVGGTGLVGAETARLMASKGHEVTLMSRNPTSNPALAEFAHIAHDYIKDDISIETLNAFDWLVFSAGADIRMLPEGESDETFFMHANGVRVPHFFEQAAKSNISKAVYIGTFYPIVAAEKIETSAYVRSRYEADKALRAYSSPDFEIVCLNAPYIIGQFPGIDTPHLEGLTMFAAGKLEGVPLVAPDGGVNHISSLSVAEAVLGGFMHGEAGRAYLIGDENLTWKEYFELFCEAVGNPQDLDVITDAHPMFPDIILYAGRNATVSYDSENGVLNYGRNRIKETIENVVASYTS